VSLNKETNNAKNKDGKDNAATFEVCSKTTMGFIQHVVTTRNCDLNSTFVVPWIQCWMLPVPLT